MSDDDKFKEQLDRCYELFKDRNAKYGDSWKILSVTSNVDLCRMKLYRISKMGVEAAKTEDELMDVCNYMIFALLKLKDKNEDLQ